jgi:hypothetical protein
MYSGETDGAFPVLDPRGFYGTSGACSVSPFATMVSGEGSARRPRQLRRTACQVAKCDGEVVRVTGGLSRANDLLGTLAADPSLRGSLDALSLALIGGEPIVLMTMHMPHPPTWTGGLIGRRPIRRRPGSLGVACLLER